MEGRAGMAGDPTHNSRGRRLVSVIALTAMTVFALLNASAIFEALSALWAASPSHLLLGTAVSILAIGNRGLLSHSAHSAAGLSSKPASMTRTASIGFAASKILVSGGASGLAVFVRRGREQGFSAGRVTAACLVAAGASAAAMGIMLSTSIGLLTLSGDLTGWWLAAAIGFSIYVAVMVTVLTIVVRRQDVARRSCARVQRMVGRIRRRPVETDSALVDDLYGALRTARARSRWSQRAVWHALASKLLGTAALLSAAHAVGIPISIRDAVVIYSAALVASLITVIPGGVGTVEASTGAMFLGVGASVPAAAVAVALYRVFDLWLPLTIGVVLGRAHFRMRHTGDPGVDAGMVPQIPPVVAAASA